MVIASILMIQGLELLSNMVMAINIPYQLHILLEQAMKNSFSERISQEIQAIWGKYGEKKTAVYLFLPSQRMAADPFRMLKRTMHFF